MGRTANTSDPCTSREGIPKERWPNAISAWFVVSLVLEGKHRGMKLGKKSYAYHCKSCEGWHLSSCRNSKDRKRHKRGLQELARRLGATKSSQSAGKNKRNEEE